MTSSHSPAGSSGGRLKLVAGLVVGFMLIEIVAGLLTGSLALLSDAAHMGTDALGPGMALAAIMAGPRRGRANTYGLYRLEILAALANTLLLFGAAGYVIIEAISRWSDPPGFLERANDRGGHRRVDCEQGWLEIARYSRGLAPSPRFPG